MAMSKQLRERMPEPVGRLWGQKGVRIPEAIPTWCWAGFLLVLRSDVFPDGGADVTGSALD
jgi:hypothetical protein